MQIISIEYERLMHPPLALILSMMSLLNCVHKRMQKHCLYTTLKTLDAPKLLCKVILKYIKKIKNINTFLYKYSLIPCALTSNTTSW